MRQRIIDRQLSDDAGVGISSPFFRFPRIGLPATALVREAPPLHYPVAS
jgi:hypothetical protein